MSTKPPGRINHAADLEMLSFAAVPSTVVQPITFPDGRFSDPVTAQSIAAGNCAVVVTVTAETATPEELDGPYVDNVTESGADIVMRKLSGAPGDVVVHWQAIQLLPSPGTLT